MAEIFRLPAVSPTMEVGTIEGWTLDEGATFASGDVLLEVGTDKASIEAQIFEDGVLLKRLVAEGDEVPVDAPIAIFGAEGEAIDDLVAQAMDELAAAREAVANGGDDASTSDAPANDAPEPAPSAAPEPAPSAASTASGDIARTWHDQPLAPVFLDPPGDVRIPGASAPSTPRRVIASPLARAMAADRGVDLARLKGSGPSGRIVAADVDGAPTAGRSAAPPPGQDETIKHTPMRRTIAKRLLASHQDIPSFFLTRALDTSGFVALRTALKAQRPELKVSYNDLLVACVARALRDFPRANASWGDGAIVRHGRVDVGIAVAVDDGLLTPVLRGADQMGLVEIGETTRALAAKAREGTLQPDEYQGNTFTVSNLGMYGIDQFTAIINPPASAILAVGAMKQVPVVEDGQLAVGWRMDVTMTCDHRVIDGATGAEFLQVLAAYVQSPALLLV